MWRSRNPKLAKPFHNRSVFTWSTPIWVNNSLLSNRHDLHVRKVANFLFLSERSHSWSYTHLEKQFWQGIWRHWRMSHLLQYYPYYKPQPSSSCLQDLQAQVPLSLPLQVVLNFSQINMSIMPDSVLTWFQCLLFQPEVSEMLVQLLLAACSDYWYSGSLISHAILNWTAGPSSLEQTAWYPYFLKCGTTAEEDRNCSCIFFFFLVLYTSKMHMLQMKMILRLAKLCRRDSKPAIVSYLLKSWSLIVVCEVIIYVFYSFLF